MPIVPPGDTVDRRPEVLPADLLPLFDDRFVQAWDRYGEFVAARSSQLAHELGLVAAARGRAVTAAQLCQETGLGTGGVVIVDWLLRVLTDAGEASVEDVAGEKRYRVDTGPDTPEPERLRDAAVTTDPGVAPAFDLAEIAAAATPAVLRGELTGEQVLLAPDRLPLWQDYFSNDNLLYGVNNLVAAEACLRWAPEGAFEVLEIGGGLGSAADTLLGRLDQESRLGDLRAYRFTDLVLPFLRRGQRLLQGRWGDRTALAFGRLDMDRPLDEQGIEPGSVDLLWAVNTFHVARDLGATLRSVADALSTGGVVVIGECVRPFPAQPLEPELIFNLLATFREVERTEEWRPHGGFLTPEQWLAACEATGLEVLEMVPDLREVRRYYRNFVVSAVVARRREDARDRRSTRPS